MHDNDLAITVTKKNEEIKSLQEEYAEAFSTNQNIKKESIKRSERIKIIDQEIESWKNLLVNSEKMINELNSRKDTQQKKLDSLEKQPQTQAERKGQISESLRISEKEKSDNEILIDELDKEINELRSNLNTTKEESIEIRERKASSGATIAVSYTHLSLPTTHDV